MIAFDHRIGAFEERGVQVLGVSIDDADSHSKWRETPIPEGGIGPVKYPLLCDEDRSMTNAYDVLHEPTTFAMRGTFLINKDGLVMHQVVNNLPLGRDMDELLRVVDALQFHETEGMVCPAGWAKGKPGMTPSKEGVASYLADNAKDL